MRKVDNEKERNKIWLRSSIQSCITNVTSESNKLQEIISALQNAVGGSPSGIDVELIGACQQTLQQISVGLQNLNQGIQFVDQIKTSEEVPDDEC